MGGVEDAFSGEESVVLHVVKILLRVTSWSVGFESKEIAAEWTATIQGVAARKSLRGRLNSVIDKLDKTMDSRLMLKRSSSSSGMSVRGGQESKVVQFQEDEEGDDDEEEEVAEEQEPRKVEVEHFYHFDDISGVSEAGDDELNEEEIIDYELKDERARQLHRSKRCPTVAVALQEILGEFDSESKAKNSDSKVEDFSDDLVSLSSGLVELLEWGDAEGGMRL